MSNFLSTLAAELKTAAESLEPTALGAVESVLVGALNQMVTGKHISFDTIGEESLAGVIGSIGTAFSGSTAAAPSSSAQ